MVLALILIGIALMEWLWFDLGPNIVLVTLACVVVGVYGGKWARLVVPLVIMILSDYYLGMGIISFFTWTGFMMMAWLPGLWNKVFDNKGMVGMFAGLSGTFWFYLWTNYGVWATDRWGMYSHDISGLMMAYINGLPFLRLQIVSTLLFVPLGIVVYELVKELKKIDRSNFLNMYLLLTN